MNILKEGFHKAKNYAVYYGINGENILASYDFAVVEPCGHSSEGITKLKAGGTIVLAYMSVMEIHPSNPEFRLVMGDILKGGSGEAMNREYGTYILDMGSKKWNDLLLHKTLQLCFKHGYDGVFMDTIGDVDTDHIPAEVRRGQLVHAVNFVRTLRNILPDRIIVQNNGIGELCIYTAGYIDGICWEGIRIGDRKLKRYNDETIHRLRSLKNENNIKIMMLTENISKDEYLKDIHKIAGENGFLFYNASRGYASITENNFP